MLKAFKRDFETILKADAISEDVIFISEKTEYPIKAVIYKQDMNGLKEEGRIMSDTSICFCNLPFAPKVYDIIKQDEVEYKIKAFEKQVTRYKLELEVNKRSANAHSTGRYR